MKDKLALCTVNHNMTTVSSGQKLEIFFCTIYIRIKGFITNVWKTSDSVSSIHTQQEESRKDTENADKDTDAWTKPPNTASFWTNAS